MNDQLADLMADTTEYCCYCGNEKITFHCCGENHFETFAQMSNQDQQNILNQG
jgi:hypothetical protein